MGHLGAYSLVSPPSSRCMLACVPWMGQWAQWPMHGRIQEPTPTHPHAHPYTIHLHTHPHPAHSQSFAYTHDECLHAVAVPQLIQAHTLYTQYGDVCACAYFLHVHRHPLLLLLPTPANPCTRPASTLHACMQRSWVLDVHHSFTTLTPYPPNPQHPAATINLGGFFAIFAVSWQR